MDRVDPELAILLAEQARIPAVDLMTLPLEEARALHRARWQAWNQAGPRMAEVNDTVIQGVQVRTYRPAGESAGCIVFVHGGGWMFGSPDSHDDLARRLAADAKATIVSVDYRLAPEHRFPAASEDVEAVIDGLESGGAPFRPGERIAIAGDSAGASIALSVLLRRRDRGASPLAGGALFYGCYGQRCDTPSFSRFGDGRYGLSKARMETYWRCYAGQEAPEDGVDLLSKEMHDLPPLYLHVAGLDVLLDDTLLLAGKLAAAGNRLRLDIVPGLVHGHLQMASKLSAAREVIGASGQFLRNRLLAAARDD